MVPRKSVCEVSVEQPFLVTSLQDPCHRPSGNLTISMDLSFGRESCLEGRQSQSLSLPTGFNVMMAIVEHSHGFPYPKTLHTPLGDSDFCQMLDLERARLSIPEDWGKSDLCTSLSASPFQGPCPALPAHSAAQAALPECLCQQPPPKCFCWWPHYSTRALSMMTPAGALSPVAPLPPCWSTAALPECCCQWLLMECYCQWLGSIWVSPAQLVPNLERPKTKLGPSTNLSGLEHPAQESQDESCHSENI